MGRRGRANGRTMDRRIDKAVGRALAGTVGNTSAQPRRYGLAEAINRATGGALGMDGTFGMEYMPRDPRDDVPFGPSSPLNPAPLDPARKDTGRPEPRLNEYPVAWNLPGNENVPIPWATLRGAADSVDIMRRCIEVRKEQLAGLDWSFTLDDQVVQGMYAASDGSRGRSDIEADMHRRLLPEIERLTALWRNPWPSNGVSFEQWVAGVMEDHLVLDGVAVYPRVTYGGQVTAFELIDASTIKLLIDYRGARPEHPYAAFQQILYGYPRAEFSQCAYTVKDADGTERTVMEPGLSADQLYYFRENFRTFTPYGFSAVAQSLISARLYLKRQGWMLAEYDDGSTPVTWLVPDGKDGNLTEKLTFRTRRQWEDSINAEYSGQTRQRHRIKVGMPGYTPVQMTSVDERYKPEYDRHLITMLAGHFGVTSTGLGFSESGGFGNSGLHEGQENVQDKASTKPDTRMIERVINDLSRKYLDMPPELRFKFVHADAEDATEQDNAADAQRARGTLTLNDDRKRIGKSPFDFPEADMPMVKVGDGWVPIEGMAERAEQKAEAEQALVDDQLANSEAAREMDAAAAEESAEENVEKSLELVALGRWRRKRGGAARRAFICKALEPGDFKDGVPSDVEFAWWEWMPDALPDEATEFQIAKFVGADITKAFGRGNDNWRTLARDHKGRWVARGSMRVDALGPASPDKPVLAGLKRDAERRRAAASGQLPAKSPSSTISGMTSPTKLTSAQHHVLGTSRTSSAGYLIADRRVMPALERAGLAEQVRTEQYGSQWVATPAGIAALERADADLRAELDAQAMAKLTPEQRERVARIDETARRVQAERAAALNDSVDTSPARVRRGEGYTSEGDRMADENREQAAAPKRFGRRDERAAALNENMRGALAGDGPAPGSMGERIQRRQEQAVRDVVADLSAKNDGRPVAMADLRARLQREHGLDRGQQDIVLARMANQPDVNLWPEDNQKTLTDADRAAALHVGGEDKHLIDISPARSVLDTVRESAAQAEAARSIVDGIPGVREAQARRAAAGRSTSSDDPELTTVQQGKPHAGYAIPARNRPAVTQTSVADTVNPGPGVSPDAPAAPAAPMAVRALHIAPSLTGDERTKMEAFGAKSQAASEANIREGIATLERQIANGRAFIAAERSGPARTRTVAQVAEMESVLSAPRGDAAVESVKAARDLRARAEREGYTVHVSHYADSSGNPFFKMEALHPETKEGFEATWHTRKGKNGSYGFSSATLRADGRQQHNSNVKRITEAMDRAAAPKVDPEVRAAELNASRTVNPAQRIRTEDVQQGDWRWHPTEGWQKIGMIQDAGAARQRVIWGEDRETRLGTLGGDANNWIARQADKPTLPPGPEMVRALQRGPGEASKRGDVLVIERKDTTYYGGNTGLKNPRISYETYEVTSVTREGKVRKVRRLTDAAGDGYEQDAAKTFTPRMGYGRASVLPGDRIDREGLAADLRANTYPNSTTPRAPEDIGQLGDILAGRVRAEAPAAAKPAAKPSKPKAPAAPAAASPETDVAQAYAALVGRTGAASDWVSLADIRARLSHLSREQQDAAIRKLNRMSGVHVHPLANFKSLTPADRAAAMEIGDEQVHAIRIDARGREALGLA